jgi:hypothetical protein
MTATLTHDQETAALLAGLDVSTAEWIEDLHERCEDLNAVDFARAALRIELARGAYDRDTLITISDGLRSLQSQVKGTQKHGIVLGLEICASEAARLCPPSLERSENTILSRVAGDGSFPAGLLGAAYSWLVGAEDFIDNLVNMGLLVETTRDKQTYYEPGPGADVALGRFAVEEATRVRSGSRRRSA